MLLQIVSFLLVVLPVQSISSLFDRQVLSRSFIFYDSCHVVSVDSLKSIGTSQASHYLIIGL